MLNENIKAIRISKGLSQEELASKLHVVRQTISKWEQGLSVPDADMLTAISEVLETPVSTLLGETVTEQEANEFEKISEKLEIINSELAKRKTFRRKVLGLMFISCLILTAVIWTFMIFTNSPYLKWDLSDPETAVLGTVYHCFEWLFVRSTPFILTGCVLGIVLTRKRA